MPQLQNLRVLWQEYRLNNPSMRIRTAAQELEVSEAELVQTGVDGACTRLGPISTDMISALSALGKVMALTRSDALVHEVHGVFGEAKSRGNTVMFFRPGQDTRYFLEFWAFAFAIDAGKRSSLQFFDWHGTAVHKIFLQDHSNHHAYDALVSQYRAQDQLTPINTQGPNFTNPSISLLSDPEALRASWRQIQDVHEASRILRNYRHPKAMAYQDLGPEYARLLNPGSVEKVLTLVAEQHLPIMIFGMNQGAVQSYAGFITNLVTYGPWFNILDSDFNIHLMQNAIGQVWHLSKPSQDGPINTISVLDHQHEEIMVITDRRLRGERESGIWHSLISSLPDFQINQSPKLAQA